MKLIEKKETKLISGGYYCSYCPRNEDGSMVWIQGPNELPYPPGKEPCEVYTPSYKATAAFIISGGLLGAITGARSGTIWGMLAGALFGASAAGIGRLFLDGSAISESGC